MLSLETLPARSRSPATALVQLSCLFLPLPPPAPCPRTAPWPRPGSWGWQGPPAGMRTLPLRWCPLEPLGLEAGPGSSTEASGDGGGGQPRLGGEAEANREAQVHGASHFRQDEVAFLAVAWGWRPSLPWQPRRWARTERVGGGGTVQAVLGGRRSRPQPGAEV